MDGKIYLARLEATDDTVAISSEEKAGLWLLLGRDGDLFGPAISLVSFRRTGATCWSAPRWEVIGVTDPDCFQPCTNQDLGVTGTRYAGNDRLNLLMDV